MLFCGEGPTYLFPHLSYVRLRIFSVANVDFTRRKTFANFLAWFKRYLKTLKGVLTGPGCGRVGSVGLLKLMKLPHSAKTPFSFSLTLVSCNRTDRKMWGMIQSRVNCEPIVIKRVKPSLM